MSRPRRVETMTVPAAVACGVAIECATGRVEVLVRSSEGAPAEALVETVETHHTRRLVPLLHQALERSGLAPAALEWIAVDLGPGSFTGVRVGIATARALALASGARVAGASSLTALALGTPAFRGLLVPLVPAGRADVYAGFFRHDGRGQGRMVAAPRVLDRPGLLAAMAEARGALGTASVLAVGPGAERWAEDLERAFPGSTARRWRFEGLSAADLAAAALASHGPASGLPPSGDDLEPAYVRSAQAEERVRHRVTARTPPRIRAMRPEDVAAIAAVERRVFSDPWPESFFHSELAQPFLWARVAERSGTLAGYSVAWLGPGGSEGGSGHLGNLAVTPEARRRGVAMALLDDLLEAALARGVASLTLEVRATNDAAQALYRARGFRMVGLRRGYYRDTGEDGMLMEWRAEGR